MNLQAIWQNLTPWQVLFGLCILTWLWLFLADYFEKRKSISKLKEQLDKESVSRGATISKLKEQLDKESVSRGAMFQSLMKDINDLRDRIPPR